MNPFSEYLKSLPSYKSPEIQDELNYREQIINEIADFYQSEFVKMTDGKIFVRAYLKQEAVIHKFLNVISDNISDSNFVLNTFVNEMHVSRSTLYRITHDLFGNSPFDLIMFIRMRYAQLILAETSFQIAEVTRKVGFNCPKHFTFCFRKRYGYSPSAYRKKIRQTQSVRIRPSNEKEYLNKVTNLITKNISDPDFGISNLASEMGNSQSTLYRNIKSFSGISPTKYIRSIKLQHAKSMLNKSGRDVLDVVYASGFSDPQYFRRCFRKEFGITSL